MAKPKLPPGVVEVRDSQGQIAYKWIINRKGHGYISGRTHSLDLSEKARKDKLRELEALENGIQLEPNRDNLADQLRVLVEKYLADITPTKEGHVEEASRLKAFLKHPLCKRPVGSIKRKDAYDYRDERVKVVTAPTVRREITIIRHVFSVAMDRWEYNLDKNPFHDIEIRGANVRREPDIDYLNSAEFRKIILKACDGSHGRNRFYSKLAIQLTMDTGLRLQELFGLHWNHVNLEQRRIRVWESKTDYLTGKKGRIIVIPARAIFLIAGLASERPDRDEAMKLGHLLAGKSPVFPMTQEAFEQQWQGIIARAIKLGLDAEKVNVAKLRFQDLRHVAGTRFDAADLTMGQQRLMMGHSDSRVTAVYVHAELARIEKKLDLYDLGMSMDEYLAKTAREEEERRQAEREARRKASWERTKQRWLELRGTPMPEIELPLIKEAESGG
jgi:integrase